MEFLQSESNCSQSAIFLSFNHQILTELYIMFGVEYWKSLESVCAEKANCGSHVTKKRSPNADRSVHSTSLSKDQKWCSDSENFLLSESSGAFYTIKSICYIRYVKHSSQTHHYSCVLWLTSRTHPCHTSILPYSFLWLDINIQDVYRLYNNSPLEMTILNWTKWLKMVKNMHYLIPKCIFLSIFFCLTCEIKSHSHGT